MDDFYGYAPGTTKTIKSKLLPDLDLKMLMMELKGIKLVLRSS